MRLDEILKKSPFSERQIKDYFIISEWFSSKNISAEKLKAEIEDMTKRTKERVSAEKKLSDFYNSKTETCPECGHKMIMIPIKIPQGNSNINGYKTRFFCNKCAHETLTVKTVKEILNA